MKSPLPSVLLLSIAGLGHAIACSNGSAQESGNASADGAASSAPPSAAGGGSATTPSSSPSDPTPGVTSGPTDSPTTEAPDTEAPDSTTEDPAEPAVDTPATSTEPSAGATQTAPPDEPSTEEDPAQGGNPLGPVDTVRFSVPSGTFEGSLSVSMTVGVAGAEIRYTTDGLLPTESSTLYDGAPLTLTETTQLRAQAFGTDVTTGFPVTAIYIRRTFDVTSDIPLVIMEAYGGGKPPTEAGPEKVIFRDLAFMLFEPVEGVAAISAAPTWASRSGYHVRGQSSASFEKTPYRVELWDEHDEDLDRPMIGMPADSDWAMVGRTRTRL